MAISSAKRSPTTLTTNKTLWLMQKHALKETGKQRECVIKRVAKKKIQPQRAKMTVPAGIRTWAWAVQFKIRFCTEYGNTAYIQKFAVCTAYIRHIIPNDFCTENTVRRYAPPPPVLYGVYTVPYNTYNYTYTFWPTLHIACEHWALEKRP